MFRRGLISITFINKTIVAFYALFLLYTSQKSAENDPIMGFDPVSPMTFDTAKTLLAIQRYYQMDTNLSKAMQLYHPSPFGFFGDTYNDLSSQNQTLHYAATGCSTREINFFICPVKKLTRNNVSEVTILDFWGEGRIIEGDVITGFPYSYNVNQENQKVSNGKYKGFDIPNRIPTIDYDNVDISNLVADDTFRYVTTMGSKVIPAAAAEMYRIVRKDDDARVIFYGDEKAVVTRLQEASQDNFVYAQHSTQYAESLAPNLLAPSIRPINMMVLINKLLDDMRVHFGNGELDLLKNVLNDLAAYTNKGYSQELQSNVVFKGNFH